MGIYPPGFDPRHPRAQAICDQCGFSGLHSRLRWQMQYAGNALINTRLLVCPACLDDPNPQLRPAIVRADPIPIRDPRPDPWSGPMPSAVSTDAGSPLSTDGGVVIVKENGA